MRTGQVEFLVILGVIIAASVVVIYVLQGAPGIPPLGGPQQDLATVENAMVDMIRAGAFNVLQELSIHGGYTDPPGLSVQYNGEDVAYWQYGGAVTVPDVESAFSQALADYIEVHKYDVAASFEGALQVGQATVTQVNFLDTGVVVEVELPTTLTIGDAAYPVQQPYTITVDTYFKQTYDFAQDFVSSAVENRYFEYFTMASMLGSEFDNGVQKVPTFIHLTGCGDYVFTNWNEVQPELEFLIERTLAYTYMPDKVPTDTGDSSPAPKYVLGFEEGAYRDLSIGFTVPDDFELTRSTFQLSPDPIIAFARPIPYIGRCISDPILVDYFITYPVVVKAKDPLTGNAFRFAMQVYIKDNEPGVFDQSVGGYDAVYLTQLCQELDCPVDVGVADSGGNPIPQASVRFMGCNLGVTNSEGVLSARAPCGVGPLEIHKRGYGPLLEMRSSNELDGAEIAVTRMPSFTVQFHEVNVNQLPSGAYQITPQGIREINDLHGNQAVSLSIQSGTNSALCDNGVCQWYFEDRAGQIRSVPAGSYGIAASLLEGETVAGMFISLYSIGEELDGKQLHVYVPYYLPFKDIQDATEQAAEAEKLTALLELCGVGPVTDVAVTLEASCIKTEGELT